MKTYRLIVWDGLYYILEPGVECKTEWILEWRDKNFSYQKDTIIVRSVSQLLEIGVE